MKALKYIIFMLCLLLPMSAFGTVYYVTSAGVDPWDGEAMGSAWSWANFVAGGAGGNTWGAGDTVCLSGAISAGGSTNTILSGGSGGTYAVIDGSGADDCAAAAAATITSTYTSDNNTMYFVSKNYVEIRDLSFTGTQYSAIKTE